MKKLITILIVILVALPLANAKKKKPKSGKIKDNIYKDINYNFQIELPENWDRQLQKAKSKLRLALSQEDSKVPDDLMMMPDYALIPEVYIYIDEIAFKPEEFIDSILSDTYESEFKSDIYNEIIPEDDNVKFHGLKTGRIRKLTLDENPAINWIGTASYTYTSGKNKTDRIHNAFCIAIKKDAQMLLIMGRSETQFGTEISEVILKIAQSLKW